MPAEPRQREFVQCKAHGGRVLATVEIVAPASPQSLPTGEQPLILLPPDEARRSNEERLQLRERGRYEYRLVPAPGAPSDLALLPGRGIQPSRVESPGEDRGLIEPGDHCGLLPLVVVRRGDATAQPLARGAVQVRSLKLGYREHYRGMLSFIAERCAGLVLDSRAPTRLRLDTLWQEHPRILEQQLEFLRHTLESPAFRGAVDEVLRNPHRRLSHSLLSPPSRSVEAAPAPASPASFTPYASHFAGILRVSGVASPDEKANIAPTHPQCLTPSDPQGVFAGEKQSVLTANAKEVAVENGAEETFRNQDTLM